MKTTSLANKALLSILLICNNSYGQSTQSITITCSKEDGVNFTAVNPGDFTKFLPQTLINVKVIADDVSKLTELSFKDLTAKPVVTLSNSDLKKLVKPENPNTINITINSDLSINNDANKKIPFPFQIEVDYNGIKKINNGIIGTRVNPNGSAGDGGSSNNNEKVITYIPYYDALKISQMIKNEEFKDLFSFMKFYYKSLPANPTKADILAAIDDNNLFLKEIFTSLPDEAGKAGSNSAFSGLSLSSIGSLDVTNLADGFAKFLVQRTKEELSVTFFDRFNKFISDDKYKDARILFPQTYAMLQAIGDQIYNYKAYMNALREAFEKDLDGLLPNLKKVINDGRYESFFMNHPNLKAAGLSSIDIGIGFLNKEHPGEIISSYDVSQLDILPDKNIKAAVQILQLFSKSFRSLSNGHYWVPVDSIEQNIIQDDLTFKIYLGLICLNSDKIIFSDGESFQKKLNDNKDNFKHYDTYIRDFAKQASIVVSNVKNVSGKESEKLTFTDYFNLYNSSLDLMQKASSVYELPGLALLKPSEEFIKYENIARAGGNIALDIARKNYSAAVINTYSLYSCAFGGNMNDIKAVSKDKNKSAAAQANANRLLQDRKKLDNDNDNIDDTKSMLLKYASFMAAVTQAQNSDEVEDAIEAVALPSGSARIKRETPFNVSLNAYVGLYGGWEKIKGLDNDFKFNSFGVTAPIGISLSVGKGPWFWSSGHASYSLFLSFVDIGALASFRFSNDSTVINDTTKAIASQSPGIQLEDIISPGAFISIGIPKSPLSINLGAQMGPNLRNVTTSNNSAQFDFSDNLYWRFSISLCVDIPMLNFYTKSR
jgi:hypothetical protein